MVNTTLGVQAKTSDTAITYTGLQERNFYQSIFPTEGVMGVTHLAVTQRAAGANMSVDVAAGSCVVKCDTVSNGGMFPSREDAVVNVTIPAAPASGTRTHLIVEQIRDPQSDGQASYTSAPICIADTGSGATLPPSALLLATVSVTHGQASVVNANITDSRAFAQAGIPPIYYGPWSDTLSAAGRVTVAHGLPFRPSAASIQMISDNNYDPKVLAVSSSAITIEMINAATGATGTGGQPVSLYWFAYL